MMYSVEDGCGCIRLNESKKIGMVTIKALVLAERGHQFFLPLVAQDKFAS